MMSIPWNDYVNNLGNLKSVGVQAMLNENNSDDFVNNSNWVTGENIGESRQKDYEILDTKFDDLVILYAFCDNMQRGIKGYQNIAYFEEHQKIVKRLLTYITDVSYCEHIDKLAARAWYYKHIEQGIIMYHSNSACWFEYDTLNRFEAELRDKNLFPFTVFDYDTLSEIVYNIMMDVVLVQLKQCCEQLDLDTDLVRLYVNMLGIVTNTHITDAYTNFIENCYAVTKILHYDFKTFNQVMLWLDMSDAVYEQNVVVTDGDDTVDVELDLPPFGTEKFDTVNSFTADVSNAIVEEQGNVEQNNNDFLSRQQTMNNDE